MFLLRNMEERLQEMGASIIAAIAKDHQRGTANFGRRMQLLLTRSALQTQFGK